MDATQIVLAPIVSEKSYAASARGSYMVREVGDHHTCVITDFRKGTIIFMPRDGLRDMAEPHDAGKLQCVTSNVARAMMMTLQGAKFHARAAGIAKPSVVDLREAVAGSLGRIASVYNNPIFGTWAAGHAAVGTVLEG